MSNSIQLSAPQRINHEASNKFLQEPKEKLNFFESRRILSTKLFRLLRKDKLRAITEEEAKWTIVASLSNLEWLTQTLETRPEVRELWSRGLLTLNVLNNEKAQTILEAFKPGHFLLQVHPTHKCLFISTLTTHNIDGKGKISVLRNFSIEEEFMNLGVIDLLKRKKWLVGPILILDSKNFRSCPDLWENINSIHESVPEKKSEEISKGGDKSVHLRPVDLQQITRTLVTIFLFFHAIYVLIKVEIN